MYEKEECWWRHHAFVKLKSEDLYHPVKVEINKVQGFQMGDQMVSIRPIPIDEEVSYCRW